VPDADYAQIAAITDLKHAYASYLDHAQLDELVDLFTEDAVCEFGPYGIWEGREAIRAGYGAVMAKNRGPLPGIHSVTNPRIQLDGDTATGTWYLLDLFFGGPGESPLKIIGIYHEAYDLLDSGWRISRSRIEFLWSEKKGRLEPALEVSEAS
jgi:ketosteroid isomerase-like protein